MKNKSLIYITGIFIILIILVVWRTWDLTRPSGLLSEYQVKIKELSIDNISAFEIEKGKKKVNLEKKDGIWKLNNKNADKEKVDKILNGLAKPAQIELVAKTQKQHADMEVTDSLATIVTFPQRLKILIGKTAGLGLNLRFDKSDTVYAVKGLYSSDFSADSKDWYDMTIVKIDEKNIKKLQFEKQNEKFTLLREDNIWKTGDKKEINTDKINPIIASLSSYRANSLVEDRNKLSEYPPHPELKLVVSLPDHDESLEFYKGKDDYLVKRSDDNEYFTVSGYLVKDLLTVSTGK